MPFAFRRLFILSVLVLAVLVVLLPRSSARPASAAGPLIISEVAPWSSGNSPASLAADWFEVTNTGAVSVDITGWKMDDNSNSFALSVALFGITNIAAGESVIFIETSGSAPAPAAAFNSLWFGATPAGLQIGGYSGSGVGLSTGGDAVNLYNSSGVLQANVVFGASTPVPGPFLTFDNSAGLNNTTISQLSVAGSHGAFAAANDSLERGSPGAIAGKLFVSEVAPWSSGTSFGADWFELTNTTAGAINLSGWKMDDNSNLFANAVTLNGIASIASGESVLFIETGTPAATVAAFKTLWWGASPPPALQVGSYSGANVDLSSSGDAVNIYDSGGTLQANIVFGTSPAGPSFATFSNAVGLTNTTISQLSSFGVNSAFVAASDANQIGSPGTIAISVPPTVPVKVNEVESSGGTPGDWVEFINTGGSTFDLSGYVFKDSNNANAYTLPAGSTITAGGFLVINQFVSGVGNFNFELDSLDSARLFLPGGVTLVDSFSWQEHSGTTFGRCPDATGTFISTAAPTKGAANSCPAYATWPGDPTIAIADGVNIFGTNLSGLIYEGSGSATPGVLWGARNGLGTLFRLIWNGTIWTPDPANGWGAGKFLRYPSSYPNYLTSDPDSEGVTFGPSGSAGGIYISTERDNNVSSISRPAILRFDPSGAAPLIATNDWNLTADLPPLGANLGLEGITFVPDSFLVAHGFFDEGKNHLYNPADYANHNGGLFFVGVENNGFIYAYALDHSGNAFSRVATIDSGFPSIMELQFDRELNNFWAICDNTCQGRTAILQIDPPTGRFVIGQRFERPAGMGNFNNEGFAMATQAECVNNRKPAFWSDDDNDANHALRSGTVPCGLSSLTFSKSFATANVAINGNATLTFNVANANAFAVTGVAFLDTLPAGLVVATPNGLSGSCGGGIITATAGSAAISLGAAGLAANASCSFSVNVKATLMGAQNNLSGVISSTETGNGPTASASITVVTASQAAGTVAASVAGSGAVGTTRALDAALLQSIQMYLALPNGIGKPGACLQLNNLRAQTAASTDPVVIAMRAGPAGWLAQIDSLKVAIGCP